MNEANTKYLFTKYASLFHPGKGLQKTLMGFGFECGDGWFKLLDSLFKILAREKDIEVVQVKEKYGTLRCYINGGTDSAYASIEDAEKLSATTCEICGAEGKLGSTGYWYSTKCTKCADENWAPFEEGTENESSS